MGLAERISSLNKPNLPPVMLASHVTTRAGFISACDSQTLTTKRCDVIKADVVFMTYGGPRYRHLSLPYTMLLHCPSSPCVFHPFDTGLINDHPNLVGLAPDEVDSLLNCTRILDSVQKACPALVDLLFKDNRGCLAGKPRADLERILAGSTEQLVSKVYQKAKSLPATAGRILDRRITSIEVANTKPLPLVSGLRWLCVPITESVALSKGEKLIRELRQSGCVFAVDYYTPPDEWNETTSFELGTEINTLAKTHLKRHGATDL